jgi:hypothetical protein
MHQHHWIGKTWAMLTNQSNTLKSQTEATVKIHPIQA